MDALQNVGGGVPRLPSQSTPSLYFFHVNQQVIGMLNTRATRPSVGDDDQLVIKLKEKLADFFSYLAECQTVYQNILPKELVDGRGRLLEGLRRIFAQDYQTRQRFYTEHDKFRAEAFHDWARDADAVPDNIPSASDDNDSDGNDSDATDGEDNDSDDNASDDGASGGRNLAVARASASRPRPAATARDKSSVRYPPDDHPIWGRSGIYAGIALTGASGKVHCLNPEYRRLQRPANVFGNNGITLGEWYPSQLSAVFWGAHGSSQGGIYGTKDAGAYSVIVSGTYKDLDRDEGDIVYYSGSGSKENKDPNHVAERTSATSALHTTFLRGKLVRVLRKAIDGKNTTIWAPSCGIRYDGLYRIVQISKDTNEKGGLYEKFKLRREPGQVPLTDLVAIPNDNQRRDYAKSKEHF